MDSTGAAEFDLSGVIVTLLAVVTVVLVTASLRREEPPTFVPSPPAPEEVGETRVGPRVVTVDARDGDAWTFFDFSRSSVVEDPSREGWDLAFRRDRIIVNGGPGFAGRAGAVRLGALPFDSVRRAPSDGWVATEADSVHPALEEWYDYSMLSHLLTPKPDVWAIRTADGRYAKVELLSYYCPGAVSGCTTFRFLYQGDGSRDLGG